MPPPSALCVLQQQRGFGISGVVRRAARYAAQRGAARRGPVTSATQFVDERRTVCSARRVSPFSLHRFSFRSVKLTIALTSIALDIELDVPRRRERREGGLIRSRDSFARLRSPTFLFFFFSDGQIKFYLDSQWENLSLFFVSRSIIDRRAKGVVTIRIVASLRFLRRSTVRVSTRWPCAVDKISMRIRYSALWSISRWASTDPPASRVVIAILLLAINLILEFQVQRLRADFVWTHY